MSESSKKRSGGDRHSGVDRSKRTRRKGGGSARGKTTKGFGPPDNILFQKGTGTPDDLAFQQLVTRCVHECTDKHTDMKSKANRENPSESISSMTDIVAEANSGTDIRNGTLIASQQIASELMSRCRGHAQALIHLLVSGSAAANFQPRLAILLQYLQETCGTRSPDMADVATYIQLLQLDAPNLPQLQIPDRSTTFNPREHNLQDLKNASNEEVCIRNQYKLGVHPDDNEHLVTRIRLYHHVKKFLAESHVAAIKLAQYQRDHAGSTQQSHIIVNCQVLQDIIDGKRLIFPLRWRLEFVLNDRRVGPYTHVYSMSQAQYDDLKSDHQLDVNEFNIEQISGWLGVAAKQCCNSPRPTAEIVNPVLTSSIDEEKTPPMTLSIIDSLRDAEHASSSGTSPSGTSVPSKTFWEMNSVLVTGLKHGQSKSHSQSMQSTRVHDAFVNASQYSNIILTSTLKVLRFLQQLSKGTTSTQNTSIGDRTSAFDQQQGELIRHVRPNDLPQILTWAHDSKSALDRQVPPKSWWDNNMLMFASAPVDASSAMAREKAYKLQHGISTKADADSKSMISVASLVNALEVEKDDKKNLERLCRSLRPENGGANKKTKAFRKAVANAVNAVRNTKELKSLRQSDQSKPPGPCNACQSKSTAKSDWHWHNDCPKRQPSVDADKRVCWNCEQPGHLSFDCPKPKKAKVNSVAKPKKKRKSKKKGKGKKGSNADEAAVSAGTTDDSESRGNEDGTGSSSSSTASDDSDSNDL